MKVKVKVAQLCPTLCDPMDYTTPGQNTGVGSLSLLQGQGYFQFWAVVNTIAMHIIYKSTCRRGFISLV